MSARTDNIGLSSITEGFDAWLKEQTRPKRLLLIDDSVDDCHLVQVLTRKFNCEWSVANSGSSAMDVLHETQASALTLIFLDLKLKSPDDPIDLFAAIKSRFPSVPVIVMSGFIDSTFVGSIMKVGFAMFAQKPSMFTESFFDDMFRTLNIPLRPVSV